MIILYDRNTRPIDGTDIICSVPAIEQELRFLSDTSLASILSIIDNHSDSVSQYLRFLQQDIPFACKLLAYLVKNRQLIHNKE